MTAKYQQAFKKRGACALSVKQISNCVVGILFSSFGDFQQRHMRCYSIIAGRNKTVVREQRKKISGIVDSFRLRDRENILWNLKAAGRNPYFCFYTPNVIAIIDTHFLGNNYCLFLNMLEIYFVVVVILDKYVI